MMSWRTFFARAVIASGLVGVAMFVALRLAAASPGGPTYHGLTYAGVLRDTRGDVVNGPVALAFEFRRCVPPIEPVACRATPLVCRVMTSGTATDGAFSVNVPIGTPCPPHFFDGSDTVYDVLQGGDLLTPTPVLITPVPYARFADQAGEIGHRSGWQQTGTDRYVFSAYLRNSDVPACVGGFMTYNIGIPPSVATTRDILFSGSIDVMTRPDDPTYWNFTEHWTATFSAYTHSGYNLTLCSLPGRTGSPADPSAPTTPSVCYASNSTTLPNYIQIRRPDGDSARLNVIVPCARQMNRLSVNIDAFIRPSN